MTQVERYQPPPAPPESPLPLAEPLRRRSFQNEVLIEKFDRYLMVIKYSPHTRRRYGTWVKQFSEYLDGKNFVVVKSLEVRAFLATIYERDLQKGTMASALYALRQFYKFLQLGDQILVSAPHQVSAPKISKRLPHALSVEEIEQILRAANTPRDLALIELAFASGLRVSELSNLRIEDLDIRARSLIVREGKGGNDRVGLFGDPATAALRAYLGNRTTGFVFQPERGASPERRLSSRSILRMVVRVAKRAGIGKRVTVHTFRHSFATACLNTGMDLRSIQQLMGHRNLNFTQRYLHVATANLQGTHAKFHPRG
ncbi:MAG: tyrosine-type recombinase/integrase [Candidatus Acidiferrales bacterium]